MGEKEDYLTSYRVFFENFAATVNPEDQLPVNIAGYTITEAELAGEVLYWTTQYLSEKQCPGTLMTPLRRIILEDVRVASKKTPNEFGYKSDEAVYIALRLMQAVTARVNDVCLRYLDNARLDTLPPPPPLAQRDLKTVSCATKNSRRVMEDRHVEIGNLEALFGIETTEPTSFYAVYDGHAGSAAATYCAAHLHQYLVESPYFKTDLKRATREAYLRTDAEFIRKSNQERACGGSTAVTVAVRGRNLLAAWAGDSLALLAKRMRLMQLVRPHKPGRQDERDRIESAGGTVMYWGTWRVNGQLAVSRAIGDAQYKPYVTARPEIATIELDGDEDFVVVACDGLWDFVSEDEVALSVYRQLAVDPDDLKAVTKRLILQAKRQGSADNISIIVVFLKDPRDIAADNSPPMDLGLDNAMMNVPPFTIETDVCKRQMDAAAATADAAVSECAEAEADAVIDGNGVDNSDSDSEDLGPETAVDADDIDAEARQEPQPPTPPAHTLEEGHVDGALVDNVAESGEDSEDEWNYFKGEGEREEHNPSEEPDEPPHSETPCQDNSAWESSSVDMNSSPLNPDAPVFVPGGVAGADVLLAESPRKPLPMDDIELPDVTQFKNEAVVRPAELLDLDNCDQLNGHHNLSLEDAHTNGNDKCDMDSLGFGFNVGIEPDKVKDNGLIQDFERIQKDTTDFCNIQVFQTHAETNPFAIDGNHELFERLKNKERDPMSMSFYQEKDDDTCERLVKNELHVDLNAVQPLPDSDDEDLQQNGVYENEDKENVSPEQHTNLFDTGREFQEPNNDIIRFDDRPGDLPQNDNFGQGDNCVDYNVMNTNNLENYSNIEFESNITQDTVLQTDTPESHKLLFEQIPEIPDGKSSELGFTNDEVIDPSESDKEIRPFTPQDETSQDVEMKSKLEDSPCIETIEEKEIECHQKIVEFNNEVSPISDMDDMQQVDAYLAVCPARVDIKSVEHQNQSPEPVSNNIIEENGHENIDSCMQNGTDIDTVELNENGDTDMHDDEAILEAPEIKVDTDILAEVSNAIVDDITSESTFQPDAPLHAETPIQSESPLPVESLLPSESPLPVESLLPSESPMPTESQLPVDDLLSRDSPLPVELSVPSESPLPDNSLLQAEIIRESISPRPKESPVPTEHNIAVESPLPAESQLPTEIEAPVESLFHTANSPSPLTRKEEDLLPSTSPIPMNALTSHSPVSHESLLPTEEQIMAESPIPSHSPIPIDQTESLLPPDTATSRELLSSTATEPIEKDEENLFNTESNHTEPAASPLPADVPLPRESPLPIDEQVVEADATMDVVLGEHDTLESKAEFESISADNELPAATEAVIHVDAPLESDVCSAPLEPEPSDEYEAPVELELTIEQAEPIKTEAIVEPDTLESLAPVEVVDPEATVEAEVVVESKAFAVSEEPLEVEALAESKSAVETEVLKEAEISMEDNALREVETTEESTNLEITSVLTEPIIAPVESVGLAEIIAPVESTATPESDTPVEPVVSLEMSAPLEVTALVDDEPASEPRSPSPAAPLRDTATPQCVSPPPADSEARLTPDVSTERTTSPVVVSAPAPDLLPEEPVPQQRVELITDVDIGIPESRAQEICVPITNEIQLEEAVQPPSVATPPPTPAIEASATTPVAAPLTDTSIAAEVSLKELDVAAAAVAAAGAAAGIAAVAKLKSTTTTKKSPITKTDTRTSKSAPKSTTTARTPIASATAKRPAATPAARTPTATKTPSPATKTLVSTTRTTPAARTPTATTKPTTPAAKSATPATKTTPAAKTTPPARAPAATRPAPTKANGVAAKPTRDVTGGARAAAPSARAAPASRPAPKPSAPKTEAAPRPAARPVPRPGAPAAKAPPKATELKPLPTERKPLSTERKPLPTERKPLPNGDAKEAKAPAGRPAPRAPPRAPAPASKMNAPKPLPRATPLDKQSKDLANKRITAKAAPPRTAPAKSTAALNVKKAVPKKPLVSVKKDAEMNGLMNGDAVTKPPPSPPAADNALLPDVIA